MFAVTSVGRLADLTLKPCVRVYRCVRASIGARRLLRAVGDPQRTERENLDYILPSKHQRNIRVEPPPDHSTVST